MNDMTKLTCTLAAGYAHG